MTLERAVEVLNEREHCGYPWCVWNEGHGRPTGAVGEEYDHDYFAEFEAIAIAEKYERDAERAGAMTLHEAVAILNERGHRGHAKWTADREPEGDEWARLDTGWGGRSRIVVLWPFEAIAIAEKYEREVVKSVNLERAVEVLNQYRHRDYEKWYVSRWDEQDWARLDTGWPGPERFFDLDGFEAAAIAEKYEREAKLAPPVDATAVDGIACAACAGSGASQPPRFQLTHWDEDCDTLHVSYACGEHLSQLKADYPGAQVKPL